ncbi:hypothetical protein RhiXN_08441 [Rhizoctonia solani]|uniref:Uncharacterized protein n=1 Tax=Rhizoctonia solani TaxID=456999 RepID=A0A8H8P1K6_9AGAM|nr:uncharacterized protein RhiXN_08441 [Rhizoctonia solani]QRW23405.1 hypothetical protein RhiXN_08441 [Rhizoctonia solani]
MNPQPPPIGGYHASPYPTLGSTKVLIGVFAIPGTVPACFAPWSPLAMRASRQNQPAPVPAPAVLNMMASQAHRNHKVFLHDAREGTHGAPLRRRRAYNGIMRSASGPESVGSSTHSIKAFRNPAKATCGI